MAERFSIPMNGNQIEQGRAAPARLPQEERKKLVGSLKVIHGRKLKREAEADTAKKGAAE